MTAPSYCLLPDTGARTTLGLIVLQVDETIEREFQRIFADPAIALYVSRIPSGADLTPETIAAMEQDLPHAAGLLPQTPVFDAVAYACTSGTTLIGPDRVAALVGAACQTKAICDPLTATLAACRALGARRIGLVSPYTASISAPLIDTFTGHGIDVVHQLSFDEAVEANVARIDPGSIATAARQVAQGVDAVFLSCTNLRTLEILAPLEAELGLPVLSSNLTLAHAMARAAGERLGGPAADLALMRSNGS